MTSELDFSLVATTYSVGDLPLGSLGIFGPSRMEYPRVIPLVNYLPSRLRNRLAPHVRAYTRGDLRRLTTGLPLKIIQRTIIFGAYDNLIARWPHAGRALRTLLQALERTPLRFLGLSHFIVFERC